MTIHSTDASQQHPSFEVTGCAAHSRLVPLVPQEWKEARRGNSEAPAAQVPDFLWENAPRHETRNYRDVVKCYSHLPNGLAILDSKWALARLLSQQPDEETNASILSCHCFRGISGFQRFCQQVNMFQEKPEDVGPEIEELSLQFPDLCTPTTEGISQNLSPAPTNLWVVKDDMSNGAGGIWIISPDNAEQFLGKLSPLIEEHKYVAQQYTWPLVLHQGRKCHVRVYGLFTSDGRAFLHCKCFLHVANEEFELQQDFEASVHITNCCANSHDAYKFAGEICADLDKNGDATGVVGLNEFYPSISASVATLAKRAFPFLKGGKANNGFEYLGMDFILSYSPDKEPIAYLLEVNAPPSQDTATGLAHAEDLHDAVIRDILSLWVLPKVQGCQEEVGGWMLAHEDETDSSGYGTSAIVPSKAVILNKIRWAIFDRKATKEANTEQSNSSRKLLQESDSDLIAKFARSQFPYFLTASAQIFFESAGGAQVPYQVLKAMEKSLACRNRSVVGAQTKDRARQVVSTLLGSQDYQVFFGANATTLLDQVARRFEVRGLLTAGDEIILCSENHAANVNPWLQVAQRVGAVVKWWTTTKAEHGSHELDDLLSSRTKIVALSHAANTLGQVRPIQAIIANQIKIRAPNAQVVVDGVAAVPHIYPNVTDMHVDWYVVSCHKLFGPHLGVLCERPSAISSLVADELNDSDAGFELGTVNYEACAGIIGLGAYFRSLALFQSDETVQPRSQSTQSQQDRQESVSSSSGELTTAHVVEAYRRISVAETVLAERLLSRLRSSTKIRILESSTLPASASRLPVVCFQHSTISSATIVKECNAACRQGAFLSTQRLWYELHIKGDVARFSLAHYNTVDEIDTVVDQLETLEEWF